RDLIWTNTLYGSQHLKEKTYPCPLTICQILVLWQRIHRLRFMLLGIALSLFPKTHALPRLRHEVAHRWRLFSLFHSQRKEKPLTQICNLLNSAFLNSVTIHENPSRLPLHFGLWFAVIDRVWAKCSQNGSQIQVTDPRNHNDQGTSAQG